MNENAEDESPQTTSFDVPDIARLYRQSEELVARARVVNEQSAQTLRRMHEAIRISDEHLQNRRRSWRTSDNGDHT